ncbi:hypothetical protein R1flu_028927 [Riccia fluitans]|uniref:Retrotransposon gag domain-containing protein n=1 Tax=Riccia fluitans TaxID=41844 RepID=A0ABD1XN38_9MARC
MFKITLVDQATSFADDLDEEGVTTWAALKGKFITQHRGDINLITVLDNLARVQHKKGEPVLAYINRFRTKRSGSHRRKQLPFGCFAFPKEPATGD